MQAGRVEIAIDLADFEVPMGEAVGSVDNRIDAAAAGFFADRGDGKDLACGESEVRDEDRSRLRCHVLGKEVEKMLRALRGA